LGKSVLEDSEGNKPKSDVHYTATLKRPEGSALDWYEAHSIIEGALRNGSADVDQLDDKDLEMELHGSWLVGEIPISIKVPVQGYSYRTGSGVGTGLEKEETLHGLLSVKCDAETDYHHKLIAYRTSGMQMPYPQSVINFGNDEESVQRSLAQGILEYLAGRIPNGEVTLKPMKIRQEGDEVTYDLANWSTKYDGKSFIASCRDAQDRNNPRDTKGSFEVGFNTDMSQIFDKSDKKELVLGSQDPVSTISYVIEDGEEFVEGFMDEYSDRIRAYHTAIKIDEPVIESLITHPRLLGQRTWRSTFLPEVTLTGVVCYDLDKTDIQPAVDAVLTLRVEEIDPSQLDSDAKSEAKEEEVQGSSEKDDDWSPQALTAATQRMMIE
jgi:hypothetical protein